MSYLCTPWKSQKTMGFLTFLGGVQIGHSHDMAINDVATLFYHELLQKWEKFSWFLKTETKCMAETEWKKIIFWKSTFQNLLTNHEIS